ncbi:hypothetical protein LTR08_008838 [Meristemomyces frigidus]|nr:hypothetical protein LTR08_008838 [Meristemomyces frigidus]
MSYLTPYRGTSQAFDPSTLFTLQIPTLREPTRQRSVLSWITVLAVLSSPQSLQYGPTEKQIVVCYLQRKSYIEELEQRLLLKASNINIGTGAVQRPTEIGKNPTARITGNMVGCAGVRVVKTSSGAGGLRMGSSRMMILTGARPLSNG